MSKQPGNVVPISQGQGSGSNGGGDGYGERLARIEAKLEFFATKEDIQKIKVWVLGGVLGGMAIATGLAVTIIKFFFAG